jgi:hypothetical protein
MPRMAEKSSPPEFPVTSGALPEGPATGSESGWCCSSEEVAAGVGVVSSVGGRTSGEGERGPSASGSGAALSTLSDAAVADPFSTAIDVSIVTLKRKIKLFAYKLRRL